MIHSAKKQITVSPSWALAMILCALGATNSVGCSHESEGAGPAETPEFFSQALGGVPVGAIRGSTDITQTLRDRLFDDSDPNREKFEIDRVAGSTVYDLRDHLGQFGPSSSGSSYQSGDANAFGMVLWHQVSARFGEGMAALCAGGTHAAGASDDNLVKFAEYVTGFGGFGGFGGAGATPQDAGSPSLTIAVYPRTAKTVRAVCTLGGDAGARQAALGALFDAVMGYGGSLAEERRAFVDTFGADGSPFVAMSPEERVAAAFEALMLNPYFLLAD